MKIPLLLASAWFGLGAATASAATVEIVDTGNGLLVIRSTDFPQTTSFEVDTNGLSPNPTAHAGDQADLHAILDSIRLTALPATH